MASPLVSSQPSGSTELRIKFDKLLESLPSRVTSYTVVVKNSGSDATSSEMILRVSLTIAMALFDAINTQKLRVSNRDSLPREVLLTLGKTAGQVEPKPASIIGKRLRYEIVCPPGQFVERTIVQTQESTKSLALSAITRASLSQWQKDNAEIDANLIERLGKIFKLEKQIQQVRDQQQAKRSVVQSISDEQSRITRILQALRTESKTQDEYLNQLSRNEAELRKNRVELKAFNEKVSDLNLELQRLYGNQ